MRRYLIIVFILVGLACGLPGCGEDFDTKEDPTLDEIMDIGKGYLREGNGGSAAEAFSAALRIAPDYSEAKFGIIIARNQQFIALLDALISFATSMETVPPDNGLDALVLAETEPIGDYIQDFLEQSADRWYKQVDAIYDELMLVEDPYFEIDYFSMEVQGVLRFDLGGRLDRTDLHLFGVLNSLVRAIADIALAYDINYDFFSIQLPELALDFSNLSLDDPEAIAALIESLDPIFQLLEDLLTYEDNPDFLTFKDEESAQRIKNAGVELGSLFWRLHLMIESAYAETGAQDLATVRYIDSNRDNLGDPQSESLYIPAIGVLDPGLTQGLDELAVLTASAFWDQTDYDTAPNIPNPFYIAYANGLLEGLDILPFVINKEFLESLGIDIPFLGDDFRIVIDEIPYILPIDVGPWFADPSPTGLKDLLWNIVQLWDVVAALLPELLT
ncbi:MAG: hypothetical protein P9L99_01420 [Candidatus Lernaella stagnicola]|nr:hypothetical protein [Candidatus Lernaella stagnicola]